MLCRSFFYLLYLNSRFCHLQNTLKMPTKSESKRLVHSWECFGLPISWRIPFQMNDKELTILFAIRVFSANKLNRHAQAHWDKNNDIHPFDKHNGTKQKTLFFSEMKWNENIAFLRLRWSRSTFVIVHFPLPNFAPFLFSSGAIWHSSFRFYQDQHVTCETPASFTTIIPFCFAPLSIVFVLN